jgi:hypothetical protein
MPPVVIPSSMIECTVTGAGGTGDVWANVHALSTTVTVTDSLLTTLAGHFQTLYAGFASDGLFSSGWSATNVKFTYNDGLGGIAVVNKGITAAGTTAARLPAQLAIVASHQTGLASRSKRGRTYVGPLQPSVLGTDGNVPSTIAAGIVTRFNTFRTNVAAAACAHVVWSRKLNSFQAVTSTSVGPYVDTQRRRRSNLRG